MRYKYFDHTADAMFEAYGSNLEEQFENAALAVVNLMVNSDKLGTNSSFDINISAQNPRGLLFDFINEILFYLDTEIFLPKEFDISIKNNVLTGTMRGSLINDMELSNHVKAPTYNNMSIEKEKITMVVDI